MRNTYDDGDAGFIGLRGPSDKSVPVGHEQLEKILQQFEAALESEYLPESGFKVVSTGGRIEIVNCLGQTMGGEHSTLEGLLVAYGFSDENASRLAAKFGG